MDVSLNIFLELCPNAKSTSKSTGKGGEELIHIVPPHSPRREETLGAQAGRQRHRKGLWPGVLPPGSNAKRQERSQRSHTSAHATNKTPKT